MTDYPYLTLQDSPAGKVSKVEDIELSWGLRLVILLPGRDKTALQCNLKHATIRDQSYECLSYTWGNIFDSKIILDGHTVTITRNLADALLHLRYETKPRTLWIDALCINQRDNQERNVQVARMGPIYRHARETVIFIGPAAENSTEALLLLHDISSSPPEDFRRLLGILTDPKRAEAWDALLKLMKRPWWQRAWIIQEYSVSKDVHLFCGRDSISGHGFGKAIQTLVALRFKGNIPPEQRYLIRHVASTPIHHLWSTRNMYQSPLSSKLDLVDTLRKFRGSQCSDARDKIYSLLELVERGTFPAPDYERSILEVYQQVVQASTALGSLEILTYHNQGIETLKLKLPSWCPDWMVMRGKRILLWPNGYASAGVSRAAPIFYSGVMTLQGMVFDTIRPIAKFPSERFQNQVDILSAVQEMEKVARQLSRKGATELECLHAFRRTIVADRVYRIQHEHKGRVNLTAARVDLLWTAWREHPDPASAEPGSDAKLFAEAMYSAMCGRAFFISSQGYMGLADGTAEADDFVAILHGGNVPFCLRSITSPLPNVPRLSERSFKLVGEW